MLRQGPQPELKGWEALPGLPQEQLQPVSLQPGQPLHDRSHLPPGVLLIQQGQICLLYTSPSPRDMRRSRMPSSA